MNDRELLELAAKAVGIKGHAVPFPPGDFWHFMRSEEKPLIWSPLHDDGDALRLAVKLGLSVVFGANYVICGEEQIPTVNNANDPHAATRRAIVRAAAAIGESM